MASFGFMGAIGFYADHIGPGPLAGASSRIVSRNANPADVTGVKV
jgi:hypothetical protein